MFNLSVPVVLKHEDKWIIASCPELGVHSQGKTEHAALKNIAEALSLFVQSCFERGTLEQVLKDCGFEPASRRVRMPRESEMTRNIVVPLPLLATQSRRHAAYAH